MILMTYISETYPNKTINGTRFKRNQKNYQSFSDEKLIRIVSEEAASLRPEALELLKQIIKERGLSLDVAKTVDAQFRTLSEETLLAYCDILRDLPCPVCGSTTDKLNATITATVISFVVMSTYRKEMKIACPQCMDKLNNNATMKTAIMGWWGLPWGLIRTPQALLFNNKMKKQNGNPEPNDLFRAFVSQRAGRIEADKGNPDALQAMIKYIR